MNQDLLNKYLKGEVLPTDKLEILSWVEASPENRKEFLELRKLYDIALCNEPKQEEFKTDTSNTTPYYWVKKSWIKVAAIVAFTIGSTLFVQHIGVENQRHLSQTIEVPTGQHVNITLSDGTKVALNSNSKFTFPSIFEDDNRTVTLDGEGYFEVAHDSRKPFHVMTQKCDIKVLGTTFNVLAYNSSLVFETSLIKGAVQINDLKTQQGFLLKPNEQARLVNGKLIASKLESEDNFLWRNGIYVFNKESFADIFKKLENYYQIKIIVRNNDIYHYKCTGKFRQKEGLDHIIKVLQSTNNFNYKRNDQTNSILIY